MYYDPRSEPHGLAHDPGTCLVVPRPIGWITTLNPAGVVNLAPYSFFNIISTRPPFVMFSSSTRKHSQRNAETAGEFVFNLATYDLRTEMNITGSDHPEHLSEAELAGLEMAPSRTVKPPRDRPHAPDVDHAVDDDGVVDEDVDDLADDDRVVGLLSVRAFQHDGLAVFAFERDWRQRDPRRLHHP